MPTEMVELPVAIGDVLAGKYRVERVLGAGGIGIVASAKHLSLGVRVALKFLHPQVLSDRTLVARFEREAQIAARLRGEGIARVFDVEHLRNGVPFIVMEFLEGEDLDALLERVGPLPVNVAVDYVRQACAAISEAHAANVVHRDLKPQNLFLTRRPNGTALVKVLDFGISKVGDAGVSKKLTGTGEVFGTPQFMAPEQFRGGEVDTRTDIWGLGGILYMLLTRNVPFHGESMAQLCTSVLFHPPAPLRKWNPQLPVELDDVVRCALEKEPANRFSSVEEFANALLPFASKDGLSKEEALAYGPRSNVSPSAPPPSLGGDDPTTDVFDRAPTIAQETFRAVETSPSRAMRPTRRFMMAATTIGFVTLGAAVVVAMRSSDGERVAPGANAPSSGENSSSPHAPPPLHFGIFFGA